MSTWILLRGLTRETRHWGRLPEVLREAVGNDRLLLLDLPGNGEFAHLRAPSNVAGMVDFVRDAALQMDVPGPYCVLAMSLGGMVATDWAQRFPGEIERLVLINTSMRPFSRMQERLRPSAWPGLVDVAAHWRDAPRAEREIHRLTCNETGALNADLDTWCEIRRSAPVSRGNAWRQLWAAARFAAASSQPSCPLLILSSRADNLVDPTCSAKLAAAWSARHREHPWAGHDLPHDDPAWTAEQLHAWLSDAPTKAAPGHVS
ncbi:Lysophospholipase, alpha-beta hydrolase superfamily [Paraburkholderia fungorum]|uniref:Lysophospholipase, alpha-beta hydrolase superfamily n=1 Tax=Paraburkholderia fungorum TaxID=134537 RepID=A0A1H1IF78_9BURK|nr:alpha/beta hydrolase [Paraburkholderia fungorum]SDR36363.1 Lysophospholipase, alpha-beta hydrolase superfamily [Paraburkholderia fungorum]